MVLFHEVVEKAKDAEHRECFMLLYVGPQGDDN